MFLEKLRFKGGLRNLETDWETFFEREPPWIFSKFAGGKI